MKIEKLKKKVGYWVTIRKGGVGIRMKGHLKKRGKNKVKSLEVSYYWEVWSYYWDKGISQEKN